MKGRQVMKKTVLLAAACAFALAPRLSLAAGDVTVHSHLTSHGAGANLTERPRWAYVVVVQPADIHWTGAPPEAYDTTGWRPFQTFDDARFPIIG